MTAALRYEWRRLWSIRSTYWLIGGTLALQLALCLLVAGNAAPISSVVSAEEVVSAVVSLGASYGVSPLFSAYLLGLLGVLAFGNEYRHGMIRSTLTAVPNRIAVFAAKAASTVGLAVCLALACALIGLLASALFLDTQGALSSTAVWGVIVGLVLYTALFGLCGMAAAALVRNQTGAVAILLLVPSVVEGVLKLLLLLISQTGNSANEIARFLPFDAGSQMFSRPTAQVISEAIGYSPLGPVKGGIVLLVFTALLLSAALTLFVRRDA